MRHILAIVALLTLALTTNAQITYIKASGCPNAGNTPIFGTPKPPRHWWILFWPGMGASTYW